MRQSAVNSWPHRSHLIRVQLDAKDGWVPVGLQKVEITDIVLSPWPSLAD
jgi:hypothetical protein